MKYFSILLFIFFTSFVFSQSHPAITSWLQNTTETGKYYMSGNPTLVDNNTLVNCQRVEYSDDFVYVTTEGVPSYPTGPFLDNNPSNAEGQNAIFKIPLEPQENTGNKTKTRGGNIGVFINGVALFDYRDGVAWDDSMNRLCGGPGNPQCSGNFNQMDWTRDAILAEMAGFDCSKGHPAQGNYHHHQNPSAFKLDQDVVSDICNIYDAEGLYAIDPNTHAPLIGFAYDGFPIYGAYAYKNTDGTGEIVRMKSSYQLKNITTRTNGPDIGYVYTIPNGPKAGQEETFFLGYFREDYDFINHNEPDYLDEHNGRWCITPEYPNGTYAYFCTVDENWNSAYPYAVGPTYYGNYENRKVNSVSESTTVYTLNSPTFDLLNRSVSIVPNPTSSLVAIQLEYLVTEVVNIQLTDINGKLIMSSKIPKGSTLGYFNTETLYNGTYLIRISTNQQEIVKKIIVTN